MAKLLALGAFFYQAALAFGLLIAIARILPAEDYASYSIFIAATQLLAIAFFEWITFATSRFYPGRTALTEAVQRHTIVFEFACCIAVSSVLGLAAMALGLRWEVALLGWGVVVFQGGSDLQLTMLRFAGRFRDFSWMQVMRASLLATTTIAGALMDRSLAGAAAGLLGGYALYGAIVLLAETSRRFPKAKPSRQVMGEHLSYGSVAAGASVLGLLAPLGLRLILTSSLGAGASAGALLAIDLLQRPFVLIISALHAIQYPDVVSAFDSKTRADLAPKLGQYYALLVTLCLAVAAGVLAILGPVELWVVDEELRPQFAATAPLLVGLFMLRSLTQNVATTPAHLHKNLFHLLMLALIDCIGLNALALFFSLAPDATSFTIILGAAIGTLIAGLFGIKVLRSLAFRLPWPPILIAAAGLVVTWRLLNLPSLGTIEAAFLGAVAAAALSGLALYALLSTMRRGTA